MDQEKFMEMLNETDTVIKSCNMIEIYCDELQNDPEMHPQEQENICKKIKKRAEFIHSYTQNW